MGKAAGIERDAKAGHPAIRILHGLKVHTTGSRRDRSGHLFLERGPPYHHAFRGTQWRWGLLATHLDGIGGRLQPAHRAVDLPGNRTGVVRAMVPCLGSHVGDLLVVMAGAQLAWLGPGCLQPVVRVPRPLAARRRFPIHRPSHSPADTARTHISRLSI